MRAFSVCVFCGSRPGDRPSYTTEAEAFGTGLAARKWRLVYGAGDVGLMGSVANSAQAAGAEIFGVIPEHLVRWEIGKSDLTSYVVTENMHERKKVMYMNCDAMIVLPGGAGSLDEFLEVLTWRQLGLHEKPILLMNVDGFWDPLLGLIDHIIASGFAEDDIRNSVSVCSNAQEAFEILEKAEQSR